MMAHPTPRSGLQPNGLGAPLRGAVAPVLPARPRILVVTLRRIGDALLTTPLVRSIRRAWPDATLDILVYAASAGILKGNPDIDIIIAIPPVSSLAASLKLMAQLYRRYDLAVSTQSGDRPTLFAVTAGRIH